jgi:Cu/Ag efflux protein CusF
MKKTIIVFAAIVSFACQDAKQPETVQNQTLKQTPSVSPTANLAVNSNEATSQNTANNAVNVTNQNQTPKQSPSQIPKATPTVSPAKTATPSAPTPTKTSPVTSINNTVKRVDSTGVVTKINLEAGSIELDHEEIKGIMPKMIMEFFVSDKKMLDGMKVGDKVKFTLEDDRGQEKIVKLSKN